MRIALATAVIALIAAIALVAPGVASASCAVQRPAVMLAGADAAFVGRLVETRSDRWVFAVEEAVKGVLGAQVEVLRR